jgi:hypothetical protein
MSFQDLFQRHSIVESKWNKRSLVRHRYSVCLVVGLIKSNRTRRFEVSLFVFRP